MNWTLNSMQILTKKKLSSTLIRSCGLYDHHIGVREVHSKSAAPAQKDTTVQYRSSARSMFWQLQRACSSPIIWCLIFLLGSEIQQNINSGKRNSFLIHVLAQLYLHVNSSIVHNSRHASSI